MRILVIRRDNIGDLVCTTPLLAALRRRYPSAHLAALVNSYNAGVLAGNPDIDAVHVYTKLKHREHSLLATLAARLRLLSTLRRQEFDHVILAKSGFDRHGRALARRLRPKNIVGFAPGEAIGEDLHEVEIVMKLGAALDVNGPPGPLRVYPERTRVEHWKSRLPAGERSWVAVHISARVPGRIWPVENFVSLIQRLESGVILLWSPGAADDPRHPGDDARAAQIATACGPGVKLVPAKTESLEDLTAVLSLCRGFIGPDGGAMHVAAGLGLPVVAFFENVAAKKRHWRPWQVPYELVCPEGEDISQVRVDDVLEAWRRLQPK